jgi:hypothetical protein
MDTLGQGLALGVEHRRKAEFRAQVSGVAGKLLQRLSGSLEQQVVEAPLIHADQGIELMGQGEDDVEVGNGQEHGLLSG